MCKNVYTFIVNIMLAATEDGANGETSNDNNSGIKKIRCDMCRRKFKTPLGLQMHKRLSHIGDVKNVSTGDTSIRHETDGEAGASLEVEEKDHLCSVCGHRFRLYRCLVDHMVTHTGERPYPCRVAGCTKQFGTSASRISHERSHSNLRPLLCTQCGRTFKQKATLRVHTGLVHSAKQQQQFLCSVCDRVFRTQMARNFHVWDRHSNDGNHVCKVCAKQFTSRAQMRRHHTAVHLRERPWKCSICPKAFAAQPNLYKHMRVHNGEKPYLCSVCGRNFVTWSACRNHVQNHHSTVSLVAL